MGATQYLQWLQERSIRILSCEDNVVSFILNGVEVHSILIRSRVRSYLAKQINSFQPTWTLLSDDPTQMLLDTAIEASRSRVIYLAHTLFTLPFGPDSAMPSAKNLAMLQRVTAIATICDHHAEYIKRWGSLPADSLPLNLMGPGPWPIHGAFDHGYVSMINPCAIKGICIFLELARRLPEIGFAVVPTWGTTPQDREVLYQLPNVTVLAANDNIDEILKQTRILITPSLIPEGGSRIIMEAMLRGIPALAGNLGAMPESKLGVEYVLPVAPIRNYKSTVDHCMIPVPEVPQQNIEPWLSALQTLLSDRSHYEDIAKRSREAALKYVSTLRIDPFEQYLERLTKTC
jgi:Glycosyl transferases group 1